MKYLSKLRYDVALLGRSHFISSAILTLSIEWLLVRLSTLVPGPDSLRYPRHLLSLFHVVTMSIARRSSLHLPLTRTDNIGAHRI